MWFFLRVDEIKKKQIKLKGFDGIAGDSWLRLWWWQWKMSLWLQMHFSDFLFTFSLTKRMEDETNISDAYILTYIHSVIILFFLFWYLCSQNSDTNDALVQYSRDIFWKLWLLWVLIILIIDKDLQMCWLHTILLYSN